MSSSDSCPAMWQLEQLAQEFVPSNDTVRGECPPLTEYTDRRPDIAQDIRELFPALVQIEHLKPAAGDLTGPTAPAPPPHPERLGDYRILREVGRGGMGVVYEAEQESLGRHVALKVLPLNPLLNRTYLERFRREAKAAAKLHHTNIVPVFGVGEADGIPFYAMQFIRGEGLDRVLYDLRRLRHPQAAPAGLVPSEGSLAHSLLTGQLANPAAQAGTVEGCPDVAAPVPNAEPPGSSALSGRGSDAEYYRSVARIGLQIADALAYAHAQGTLHRDIKPSNLLLDGQGTLWITDFGLAKAEGADELTQPGDIVGTVRFMAPERFDGRSLPQSDVYSLCLTIYELLALRPAFDDTNKGRLIEKVLHDLPSPPPQDRPAAIRATWRRWCSRAWPKTRPSAHPTAERHGGRPASLPGGPACQGAADEQRRAAVALGAAEPGGGKPAGLRGRIARHRCRRVYLRGGADGCGPGTDAPGRARGPAGPGGSPGWPGPRHAATATAWDSVSRHWRRWTRPLPSAASWANRRSGSTSCATRPSLAWPSPICASCGSGTACLKGLRAGHVITGTGFTPGSTSTAKSVSAVWTRTQRSPSWMAFPARSGWLSARTAGF